MQQEPLLEVKELRTHFYTDKGWVTAVDGVSFTVSPGEIVGVVGESGSGKSVMAQSLLRLLEHTDSVEYDGEILFKGRELLKLPLAEMRAIRGNDISMVFQDPMTSLNPVYTIGNQLAEGLMLHQGLSRKEAREKSIDILRQTGIPSPELRVDHYPHELSGGMQQRVMIAMALSCRPRLLIADEPTTALDVTIQAQILDLILELNEQLHMGVVFITHDLGVVSEICDTVKVMYLGQIIEDAPTSELFRQPLHPYTQGLLQSLPHLDTSREEPLNVIAGTVPSLHQIPKGCRFSTRCPYADSKCREEEPPLEQADELRKVKCWHYRRIQQGKEGVAL